MSTENAILFISNTHFPHIHCSPGRRHYTPQTPGPSYAPVWLLSDWPLCGFYDPVMSHLLASEVSPGSGCSEDTQLSHVCTLCASRIICLFACRLSEVTDTPRKCYYISAISFLIERLRINKSASGSLRLRPQLRCHERFVPCIQGS